MYRVDQVSTKYSTQAIGSYSSHNVVLGIKSRMVTDGEYMWAWLAYLFGAGLLLAACWWVTQKIQWFELKYFLRVVCAVLFLVPWYTDEDSRYLSPAWLISGIEGIFDGPEAFWRAGTPLIFALGLSIIVTCLGFIGWWFYRTRFAKAS